MAGSYCLRRIQQFRHPFQPPGIAIIRTPRRVESSSGRLICNLPTPPRDCVAPIRICTLPPDWYRILLEFTVGILCPASHYTAVRTGRSPSSSTRNAECGAISLRPLSSPGDHPNANASPNPNRRRTIATNRRSQRRPSNISCHPNYSSPPLRLKPDSYAANRRWASPRCDPRNYPESSPTNVLIKRMWIEPSKGHRRRRWTIGPVRNPPC